MISEKPKSIGLNKFRVLLTLIALGSLSLGAILYFALRNDEPVKPNNVVDNQPNYTARDGSDYLNILDAARKATSQSTKINASNPVESAIVKTNATAYTLGQNELDAYRQAMRASLQTNRIEDKNTDISGSQAKGGTDNKSNDDEAIPKDDQNHQAEKRAFIKANSKLNVSVKNRIADKVLAMGTKIPAQVDQDINSDLPGQIYGHTTRDVYDSRTNSILLIPAGSNVVGTYDSSIAYGQERLLVAWTRVNLPNGQFIDLPGFGGADAKGAGFGDQVDNHYDKIWGATVLISILAAGVQLAQPQQSNVFQPPGAGQIIGQSVGTQIAQTGTTLLSKNLNLQPTLHIRPGFEFTIEVNKDMGFASAYTGNARKN